jgi:hypothetical protein
MRYLLTLALLVGLAACDPTKPVSLNTTPPAGPPEYQQGFKDGCESGIAGYASPFYKTFHTVKQDGVLAQNPIYYQIWKDAYAYCRTYVMTQATHGHGNRDYAY